VVCGFLGQTKCCSQDYPILIGKWKLLIKLVKVIIQQIGKVFEEVEEVFPKLLKSYKSYLPN
jgi:hypothetical protein